MRKIRPPKDTRWHELFRLTDDGQWVEDDGEPGVAFFGREEREWAVTLGPPLAFSRGTQAYESSEAQRAAMRACCDRYGCANGRRVNGRGEWARATRDGGTGTRQSRGPLTEPASKHLTPSEPGQGSPTSEASSGDERNSPAPGSESGEAGSVSVKDEGHSPDKSVRDALYVLRRRVENLASHYPDPNGQAALARVEAELERLQRASRTRPDYDLRCNCGAPHWLDTSIPSAIWNEVAEPGDLLCLLCIDQRLAAAGLSTDQAEFYFVGDALRSKPYAESHGEVAYLEQEVARLKEGLRRIADYGPKEYSFHSWYVPVQIARSLLASGLDTVQRTEEGT